MRPRRVYHAAPAPAVQITELRGPAREKVRPDNRITADAAVTIHQWVCPDWQCCPTGRARRAGFSNVAFAEHLRVLLRQVQLAVSIPYSHMPIAAWQSHVCLLCAWCCCIRACMQLLSELQRMVDGSLDVSHIAFTSRNGIAATLGGLQEVMGGECQGVLDGTMHMAPSI